MTNPNQTAVQAFVATKAEIDDMLASLVELSEDHFGYSPDEINWGHVGSLNFIRDTLRRLTNED